MESKVRTSKVVITLIAMLITVSAAMLMVVSVLSGCSVNENDTTNKIENTPEEELVQMYGGGNHIEITDDNGVIVGSCITSTDGIVLNALRERNKENVDNIVKVNDYYISTTDNAGQVESTAYKDNIELRYSCNETNYLICMSLNLGAGHGIKELIPFENEVVSFTGYNVLAINSFVNKAINSENNVSATVTTSDGAEIIEFQYNNEKDIKVLSITIKNNEVA